MCNLITTKDLGMRQLIMPISTKDLGMWQLIMSISTKDLGMRQLVMPISTKDLGLWFKIVNIFSKDLCRVLMYGRDIILDLLAGLLGDRPQVLPGLRPDLDLALLRWNIWENKLNNLL